MRIPAAFCGVAGLKTTYGRIPSGGSPLAPSLDTVGPMARDIEGLILGMSMLEPGFALGTCEASLVGRLRIPGLVIDPLIDAAVDWALALAEIDVIDITVTDWCAALSAATTILIGRQPRLTAD